MLYPLVNRQNRNISATTQTAMIENGLVVAQNGIGAVCVRKYARNIVRAWQGQGLLGQFFAAVTQQTFCFITQQG